MSQYTFYSLGKCINDFDCLTEQAPWVNESNVNPVLYGFNAFKFNFQSCRLYPSATPPDPKNMEKNGCICDNIITSAITYYIQPYFDASTLLMQSENIDNNNDGNHKNNVETTQSPSLSPTIQVNSFAYMNSAVQSQPSYGSFAIYNTYNNSNNATHEIYNVTYCTNIDTGSISFFTVNVIIAILCLVISVKCIYTLWLYLTTFLITLSDDASFVAQYVKYRVANYVHTRSKGLTGSDSTSAPFQNGNSGNQGSGNNGLSAMNNNRNKQLLSPIKKHSLICTFYLLIASSFFAAFRIIEIICYSLGIPDLQSPKGKQFHLVYWRLWSVNMIAYTFLEFTTMHFNILWMSATPLVYSDEVLELQYYPRYFRPLYYKNFIYFIKVAMLIAEFITFAAGEFNSAPVLLMAWVVVMFQFTWGCTIISEILRKIADKVSSQPEVMTRARNQTELPKRLKDLADKIDSFSRKCRIVGSLLFIFYFLSAAFVFFLFNQAVSTSVNHLTSIAKVADLLITLLFYIFYAFLKECLDNKPAPSKVKEETDTEAQQTNQIERKENVREFIPEMIEDDGLSSMPHLVLGDLARNNTNINQSSNNDNSNSNSNSERSGMIQSSSKESGMSSLEKPKSGLSI